MRKIFFIDLKSIQHKLSSDYSLNIYFSRRFPYQLVVHHFLRTNPYKMSIFQRSVTCSIFQELYSHIDKNLGESLRICLNVKVHVPNFGGLSGSEDRGGGDNSIQFINFGRVGDKSCEEW